METDGFCFKSKRKSVVSSARTGFMEGYLEERCGLLVAIKIADER